jgi:pimeloyl-ACP methyl ester carboxylesterase
MTVDVQGRQVAVARAGPGEPLLFLHGLADIHSAVPPDPLPALPAELARDHDVLAPAHPGYAGSDPLPAGATVEDAAFHYLDLLDAVGWGTVDIVGCSFGGWIAAEFAVRHPHRVRRLMLVSPVGLCVPGPAPALFFGAVAPRGVGGFGEARRVLFADPDGPAALDALPDEPDRDHQLRWFGGLAGAAAIGWKAPQLRNPKLASHLWRIRVPSLLVWGVADRLAPLANADAWCEALPDARLVTVPGAGNAAGLEAPDAVADAVRTFMRETARA